MFRALGALLLLLTPLLAAPQFSEEHYNTDDAEGHATWAEEEATTKHLDLEDPASWSASTEILDENHAWYRRKRSVDATEAEVEEVLEAAESVVFMPSRLRNRKKIAHEECRLRHAHYATLRRTATDRHLVTINKCNSYCCYPVADEI